MTTQRIVTALSGAAITLIIIGYTFAIKAPDAQGLEGFMVCNNAYDETYRGDVHDAVFADDLWVFHDEHGRHVRNHQCSLYKSKGAADAAQQK